MWSVEGNIDQGPTRHLESFSMKLEDGTRLLEGFSKNQCAPLYRQIRKRTTVLEALEGFAMLS